MGNNIWRILAGRTKCQTLACPISLPVWKPLWNSAVKTECTEFEVYICLNPSFKRMMKRSNTKFALAVCEFSWGLPECGVVLMESSQKWLFLTALFLPYKPGKAGKNKYLGFAWDAFFGFSKRKTRKKNVSPLLNMPDNFLWCYEHLHSCDGQAELLLYKFRWKNEWNLKSFQSKPRQLDRSAMRLSKLLDPRFHSLVTDPHCTSGM